MTTADVVSLDELRRAYRAMQDGDFRPHAAPTPAAPWRWVPHEEERVVLVCGCGGSAGTSTVALALATVAGEARVVECCSGTASGLAYAATAELGTSPDGWARGSRDSVVVERRNDSIATPNDLPGPAGSDLPTTVVDSSWDLAGLLTSPGWLGELARTAPAVVLVTRATVPGLRRLETAADLVGKGRAVAAVIGPRRWPRPVEHSVGPTVRRLRSDGSIVHVPELSALAISGLTPDPLPAALNRSAEALLALLEGPLS